jgi:formylglycine-generating enzyme required for sulfatase activity
MDAGSSRRRRGLWVPVALVSLAALAATGWRAFRTMPAAATPGASRFEPTIENRQASPRGPIPDGMVWIPGGEFSMGAQDPRAMSDTIGMQATRDSRPVHRVYVDGFWMDKTEVTNAQFAAFVRATRYVTLAERTPRAEDYPGAPPENLVAGSVVFTPPDHAVPLDYHFSPTATPARTRFTASALWRGTRQTGTGSMTSPATSGNG